MTVVRRRDIGTGAKRTLGTGDHHRANVAIFAGRGQRLSQRDPQLTVDRILATRPIQRQRPHAVAVAAQQNVLLGHQEYAAPMAPCPRSPTISSAPIPSSASTESVCCPSPGTAPIGAW